MSYNLTADVGLASPRLLTEVLGTTIHSFDSDSRRHIKFNGQDMEVQGYVDLVWCYEQSRKIFEPTRFMVTAAYNPPFDVALGRKDYKRTEIS